MYVDASDGHTAYAASHSLFESVYLGTSEDASLSRSVSADASPPPVSLSLSESVYVDATSELRQAVDLDHEAETLPSQPTIKIWCTTMSVRLSLRALSLRLNKEKIARHVATATMRDASVTIAFAAEQAGRDDDGESSKPSATGPAKVKEAIPKRGIAVTGAIGDLEILDGGATQPEWAALLGLQREQSLWTANDNAAAAASTEGKAGHAGSSAEVESTTAGAQADGAKKKLSSLLSFSYQSPPMAKLLHAEIESPHGSPADGSEGDSVDVGEELSSDGMPLTSRIQVEMSPMRFVYLHQPWLELVDYWFNGLMAEQIWSAPTLPATSAAESATRSSAPHSPKHPRTPSPTTARSSPVSEQQAPVNRMRFELRAESPTIVLPTHVSSTQSLALRARELTISRRYSRQSESEDDTTGMTISHFDINLSEAMLYCANKSGSVASSPLAPSSIAASKKSTDTRPTAHILNAAGKDDSCSSSGACLRVDASWPMAPAVRDPKYDVDMELTPLSLKVRVLRNLSVSPSN